MRADMEAENIEMGHPNMESSRVELIGDTCEAVDARINRIIKESIAKHERKAAFWDRMATVIIWSLAFIGMGILFFIIGTILWRGLATAVQPGFIFGEPEAIKEGGGIGPMVVSSFYLAFLTVIIVLPIGIGAAIYMSEFAKEGWATRAARFGADSLATVPSVIFGIFGAIILGSVVIESMFSWPGIGRLVIESFFARDYPVVQVFVLFVTFLVVMLYLLLDIVYAYIDPRIRYQ